VRANCSDVAFGFGVRRRSRVVDDRKASDLRINLLEQLHPFAAARGLEIARWSLRLLEEKVVELHIVERASDNTIGRTLKKTFSSRVASSNG
jgi:hypothetical protein